MLWTSSQQTVIDQFIQEIKTIGWFKQVGEILGYRHDLGSL